MCPVAAQRLCVCYTEDGSGSEQTAPEPALILLTGNRWIHVTLTCSASLWSLQERTPNHLFGYVAIWRWRSHASHCLSNPRIIMWDSLILCERCEVRYMHFICILYVIITLIITHTTRWLTNILHGWICPLRSFFISLFFSFKCPVFCFRVSWCVYVNVKQFASVLKGAIQLKMLCQWATRGPCTAAQWLRPTITEHLTGD